VKMMPVTFHRIAKISFPCRFLFSSPMHSTQFADIVANSTESSTNCSAGSELDLSYGRTSGLSTPSLAAELEVSPPISTIPSYREFRRRKTEKMVITSDIKLFDYSTRFNLASVRSLLQRVPSVRSSAACPTFLS
jgi:hypothetical protein